MFLLFLTFFILFLLINASQTRNKHFKTSLFWHKLQGNVFVKSHRWKVSGLSVRWMFRWRTPWLQLLHLWMWMWWHHHLQTSLGCSQFTLITSCFLLSVLKTDCPGFIVDKSFAVSPGPHLGSEVSVEGYFQPHQQSAVAAVPSYLALRDQGALGPKTWRPVLHQVRYQHHRPL